MKIAFVGFGTFPAEKARLQGIIQNAHEVVAKRADADLVFIPHHLFKVAPKKAPWIAVWITGYARFQVLNALANPPKELITNDVDPDVLVKFLADMEGGLNNGAPNV